MAIHSASDVAEKQSAAQAPSNAPETVAINEKRDLSSEKQVEDVDSSREEHNLVYDEEVEPELHARTYVALLAMFLLNMVQVVALQGPPAVVSCSPLSHMMIPSSEDPFLERGLIM